MVVLLGYFIAMSPGIFMEKFTGGGKDGSVHLELVIGYVKIAHCIGKDIDDLMGTFVQRLIQATFHTYKIKDVAVAWQKKEELSLSEKL